MVFESFPSSHQIPKAHWFLQVTELTKGIFESCDSPLSLIVGFELWGEQLDYYDKKKKRGVCWKHFRLTCMSPLTCISFSPYFDGFLLLWLFLRSFFSSPWHFSRLSPLLLCSIWYFFRAAYVGLQTWVSDAEEQTSNVINGSTHVCKTISDTTFTRCALVVWCCCSIAVLDTSN